MGFDWRKFFDWLFERNLIPFYMKKEEFMEKLSGPSLEILPRAYDHIRKLEQRNQDLEAIVSQLAEVRLYQSSPGKMGIQVKEHKKVFSLVKLSRQFIHTNMEDGE